MDYFLWGAKDLGGKCPGGQKPGRQNTWGAKDRGAKDQGAKDQGAKDRGEDQGAKVLSPKIAAVPKMLSLHCVFAHEQIFGCYLLKDFQSEVSKEARKNKTIKRYAPLIMTREYIVIYRHTNSTFIRDRMIL